MNPSCAERASFISLFLSLVLSQYIVLLISYTLSCLNWIVFFSDDTVFLVVNGKRTTCFTIRQFFFAAFYLDLAQVSELSANYTQ